jgi:hypothetical protein
VAQSYPIQSSNGNTGGQQNVDGGLSTSGGSYTLTAKSGKNYQLTGHTTKLSDDVGHEMKITFHCRHAFANLDETDSDGNFCSCEPALR